MIGSISNNDMKYLSLAAEQACKSDVLMRHGAIAVTSGKITGRGYNNYRCHSYDGFINHTCSCHAEVHCLRNMFYSQTLHKTCKTINTGKSKLKNQCLQGAYSR